MAEKVEVDIPGVGKIEAKNAASEATLLEILKAMQGMEKGLGMVSKNTAAAAKSSAQAAKGGSSGTGGGGAAGAAQTAKATAALGKSTMGTAAKLAKMSNIAGQVATKFIEVGATASKMIQEFSNIGNSITAAAGALDNIPVIGGALAASFGAVAQASKQVAEAYQNMAGSGATFGGSMMEMSRAASGAGLTVNQFADIIKNNSDAMMLLGGTTEQGAKRFAELGKTMRTSGLNDQLLRMGYSTDQINKGMASYVRIMGQTGALQGMSTAQIAQGSARYLKELDGLAKITGQSREEKEKEREELAKDAQLRAAMAGMDAQAQEEMMSMIQSFPKEQQAAIKDMIATGTITSEEALKLNALMPGAAAQVMQFGRTLQQGGRISKEQMNAARNNMILEARQNEIRYKEQGMFNQEMQSTYLGMSNLARQELDGVAKANKDQATTMAKTNIAETVEKMQQRLAEISNKFLMVLANSGMLSGLMSAFETLSAFVNAVMVPIFTVFATVITPVIKIISSVLTPVFESIGKLGEMLTSGIGFLQPVIDKATMAFTAIGNVLGNVIGPILLAAGAALAVAFAPLIAKVALVTGAFALLDPVFVALRQAFFTVYDTIEDYLLPPFMMVGRVAGSVGDMIKNAFSSLGSFVNETLLPPLNSVAEFFSSVFKPVLDPVVEAFTAVKEAVGNFFRSINSVGDIIDMMKLSFRNLALQLKEMWYAIKDFIPGLKDATPEERAALEAEKTELKEDKRKLTDRLSKQAEENLKKQKAIETKRQEERAARDKKFYDDRDEREKAASGGSVDLSSPEAMLVSAGRMYEGQIAKNADAATAEIAKTKEMSGARQAEADALVSLANAKNEEEVKAAEATLKASREKIDLVKKELDMAREKAAIERKAFNEALKRGPAGTPTPMNRAGAPTPPQAGKIGGGGGGRGGGGDRGASAGGGGVGAAAGGVGAAAGGGGAAAGGGGAAAGGGGAAAGGGGLKMPGVSDKQPGGVSDSELMPSAGDAAKYLKTPTGANLDGLDDSTQQRLAAMAAEYFNATGKKIQVNTAYRSTEEQAELFRKYGSPRAARPGRSKHEVGLAFDINSSDAATAISLGLFDKYGFHRPIAAETWHIEPVEARGGSPDNPVNPGQKVLVANAGKESVPESGKMEKFANGGITSGPSIAGEAGPEAIIPLPDGRSVPLAGGSQKELVELLSALNSKMDQLVAINATLADINDRQLSVQREFGSSGLMV